MFRKRGLLMLAVSLALGLSAAMVARDYWTAQQAVAAEDTSAYVVAAAIAMPFGTRVEERHLKTVRMPEDAVPPGSFSTVEELIDKVTTQPIVAGEILMSARFVDQGDGGPLHALDQLALVVQGGGVDVFDLEQHLPQ